MIEQRPPQPNQDETRAEITKKIWGMAVGMLAICIPLSPATGSGPMIPIFVLMAAAVGTMGIWGNKSGVSRSLGSDAAALDAASKKQIQELEERLAALESITNFEHKLLEAKYPNATPISMAPVATPFPASTMPRDTGANSASAPPQPLAQSG